MNCGSVFYFAMLCVHSVLHSCSFWILFWGWGIFSPTDAGVTLSPRKGAAATQAVVGSFGCCQTWWFLLPPRTTNNFSKVLWHLLCPGWELGDVAPSFSRQIGAKECHRTSSQASDSRFNGLSSVRCFLVCSLCAQHLALGNVLGRTNKSS